MALSTQAKQQSESGLMDINQVRALVERIAAGLNGNRLFREIRLKGSTEKALRKLEIGINSLMHCEGRRIFFELASSAASSAPNGKAIRIPFHVDGDELCLIVDPLPLGIVALYPAYFKGRGQEHGADVVPLHTLERLKSVECIELHQDPPKINFVESTESKIAGTKFIYEAHKQEGPLHDLRLAEIDNGNSFAGRFSAEWVARQLSECLTPIVTKLADYGPSDVEMVGHIPQLWLGLRNRDSMIIGGSMGEGFDTRELQATLNAIFPPIRGIRLTSYTVQPWASGDTSQIYKKSFEDELAAWNAIQEFDGRAWMIQENHTVATFESILGSNIDGWQPCNSDEEIFIKRYVICVEALAAEDRSFYTFDCGNAPWDPERSIAEKPRSLSSFGIWTRLASSKCMADMKMSFSSQVYARVRFGDGISFDGLNYDYHVLENADLEPCLRHLREVRYSSPRLAVVTLSSMAKFVSVCTADCGTWRFWIHVDLSETSIEIQGTSRTNTKDGKKRHKKTTENANVATLPDFSESGLVECIEEDLVDMPRIGEQPSWMSCPAWTEFSVRMRDIPSRCSLQGIFTDGSPDSDDPVFVQEVGENAWDRSDLASTIIIDETLSTETLKTLALNWYTNQHESELPPWELINSGYIVQTLPVRTLLETQYFSRSVGIGSFQTLEVEEVVPNIGVKSVMRRLAYDIRNDFFVLWLNASAVDEDIEIFTQLLRAHSARRIALFCDFHVSSFCQEKMRAALNEKSVYLICLSRTLFAVDTWGMYSGDTQRQKWSRGNFVGVHPFWNRDDLLALKEVIRRIDFPGVSAAARDNAFNEAFREATRQGIRANDEGLKGLGEDYRSHYFIFIFAASRGKFVKMTQMVMSEWNLVKTSSVSKWYKLLAFLCATCESPSAKLRVPKEVKKVLTDPWPGDTARLPAGHLQLVEAVEESTLKFVHPFFAKVSLFAFMNEQCHFESPFPASFFLLSAEMFAFMQAEVQSTRETQDVARSVFCTIENMTTTFRPVAAWSVRRKDPKPLQDALEAQAMQPLLDSLHRSVLLSRVYRNAASAETDTRARDSHSKTAVQLARDAKKLAESGQPNLVDMTKNNLAWALNWAARFHSSSHLRKSYLEECLKEVKSLKLTKDAEWIEAFKKINFDLATEKPLVPDSASHASEAPGTACAADVSDVQLLTGPLDYSRLCFFL